MYPGNKKYLDACGLTFWHSKGYTGKGIVAATYENTSKGHGRSVAGVFAEAAPDAILLSRPMPGVPASDTETWTRFLQGLLQENVSIMTYSISSGFGARQAGLEEQVLGRRVTFFASAGNDTARIKSGAAAYYEPWMAVGAAALIQGEEKKASYSNIDPKIAFLAFGNLYTSWGATVSGTSFASPLAAGMAACYSQWFREVYGRLPTPQEIREFVFSHCDDMEAAGPDSRTGRGLFNMRAELPVIPVPEPEPPKDSEPEKEDEEAMVLPAVDLSLEDRRLSKNFMLHEFQCKCGCQGLVLSPAFKDLVSRLQALRDRAGAPVVVNSGYRCPKHDAEVGTSSSPGKGPHTYGYAADIVVRGMTVDQMAALARACGFRGIGKYYGQGFVHVDMRPVPSEWVG